jgi:hypothetical protein
VSCTRQIAGEAIRALDDDAADAIAGEPIERGPEPDLFNVSGGG